MKKIASTPARRSPAPVHFCVEALSHSAHLWQVTLTVAQPAAVQDLALPVWIPGSYLVREFAKHLQGLRASQGGRMLALTQTGKAAWQVQCDSAQALQVQYQIYAFDNSVRTAWLDDVRGFFNATSLCLRVAGQTDVPQDITVIASDAMGAWQVATGLTPVRTDGRGFGTYQASDYDELADCPFELGAFWSGEFVACGVTHRLVVAGALPSFDGARLLSDTRAICETQIRFWHDSQGLSAKALTRQVPFSRYVFMLNAVPEGYGGLEHRNSTALIASRRDLPRVGEAKAGDGYTTLLGLISHEYFHTWNVKRLRPAEFARYDYSQENYTDLLWFFEGFTSYYDDLLLRRSGLIDDATYCKLLAKTINQVLQTPGAGVQSVAEASRDAWIKYYRPDENTPNSTVSYYTKGALVALCLDLRLRAQGKSTLDAVMRGLWQHCAAGPMREEDLLTVLQAQTGRSWSPEVKAWVHSTKPLPLRELLSAQGLEVQEEPATVAERLGIRASDGPGGVQIKTVLSGSPALAAGIMARDEWLGVELPGSRGASSAWRIGKLEELNALLGTQKRFVALVAREQRILRLPVKLPGSANTLRLVCGERGPAQWPSA